MSRFKTHDEYFDAVRDLIRTLDSGRNAEAADLLRDGFACLNGLTDGWALFLESIIAVQARFACQMTQEDRDRLEAIRRDAHRAVYRR